MVASLVPEGFHVSSCPATRAEGAVLPETRCFLAAGGRLKRGQGELDNQLKSFCSDLANIIPKHLIEKACHRTKPKANGAEAYDPGTLRQVTGQGVGMSSPTARRE